jgi:hypothetical protein
MSRLADVEGVLLDERAAGLDRVAHQHGEHLVGAHRVLHGDLEERARLRVHGGLPELLRIHLAETLVALEGRAFLRLFERRAMELVEVGDRRLLAVFEDRGRALGDGGDFLPELTERRVVGDLKRSVLNETAGGPAIVTRWPSFGFTRLDVDAVPVHGGRRDLDGLADGRVIDPALVAAELGAQELGENRRRHATPRELGDQAAILGDVLQELQQRVAGHGNFRARHLDARAFHPRREEEVLELALVHQVLLRPALLDLEERRLRDEQVARLDDRHHVPEEEREEQRADVRAVDVRVRHQDDLVIPSFAMSNSSVPMPVPSAEMRSRISLWDRTLS